MGVLDKLEPEKVFGFFEEITQIPHGSYNLEGIRDYLISFAKDRNLKYTADDAGNVIIKKTAYKGYENKPGVILQGHMDMVAVCEEGSGIDMKTAPLDLFIEGDLIGARGTSLGGDDGIAVAMMMAILDSEDIPHPSLEVIITANEETGMEGASGIDMSLISGKRLINIDSEDEGVFTVGCAGGARVKCILPSEINPDADGKDTPEKEYKTLECKISGLLGGHSGQMINMGRGNAGKLMGRILSEGSKVSSNGVLTGIRGGSADNAIMSECTAIISIPAKYTKALISALNVEASRIKNEYSKADPGFEFAVKETEPAPALNIELKKASDFLNKLPYGVIAMSRDIKDLVQTSLNLGILKDEEGQLTAEFSVRSSITKERDELIDMLKSITSDFGGSNEVTGVYPGWKYRPDSPLREKMIKVFTEMYGYAPKVEAIHAGLECGFFISKNEEIDAVSIGPDMQDIHSPSERLSISSTARTYEYLLKVLSTKD